MALILNIDTSTSVCSVVLAKDGNIIGLKENNEGLNHSLLLGTYVNEILTENNLTTANLDAISISMGPGSYTGLRIGVSLAKGLCFGGNIPLIAINTLQALALSVSSREKAEALYCPMIDARRMEVYTAFYDQHNNTVVETKAEIIDENSFSELLATHKIYFFGNGSNKIRTTITSPNAIYLENIETQASHLVEIAEQKFHARQFENIAYFEPFYLKDFVVTTKKEPHTNN